MRYTWTKHKWIFIEVNDLEYILNIDDIQTILIISEVLDGDKIIVKMLFVGIAKADESTLKKTKMIDIIFLLEGMAGNNTFLHITSPCLDMS